MFKEEIIFYLEILRDEIKQQYKNKEYYSIYDDIIKILENKECNHYNIENLYHKDKWNSIRNEETANNCATNILKVNHEIREKDKIYEKNLMENNGRIKYLAVLFRGNKKPQKNEYYKNFYEKAYQNIK